MARDCRKWEESERRTPGHMGTQSTPQSEFAQQSRRRQHRGQAGERPSNLQAAAEQRHRGPLPRVRARRDPFDRCLLPSADIDPARGVSRYILAGLVRDRSEKLSCSLARDSETLHKKLRWPGSAGYQEPGCSGNDAPWFGNIRSSVGMLVMVWFEFTARLPGSGRRDGRVV